MSAIVASRQTEWQPDRVHEGRVNPTTDVQDDNVESGIPRPGGISIRQIRESMVVPTTYSPPGMILPSPPSSKFDSPPPIKRKGNFFSGLFGVKEPTQAALNQVAAQMIAQHGSTNPVKVPNVSIEKMPEHVPKVNSKWDGIPEAIKIREKWEKDQQRLAKRQSANINSHGSNSSTSGDGDEYTRRSSFSRDSYAAHDQFFLPVARGGGSQVSSPQTSNPHKFYAQSVNSSGDLASQHRSPNPEFSPSGRSVNIQSPSIASRTEASIAYTEPPIPSSQRYSMEGSGLAIANTRLSMDDERPDQAAPIRLERPSITQSIPEESVSSSSSLPLSNRGTRRQHLQVGGSAQASSRTSSYYEPEPEPVLVSSGPDVLPLPLQSKHKYKPQPNAAFLAGEARPFEISDDDEEEEETAVQVKPLQRWNTDKNMSKKPSLEKRPDTSRNRLGLKVNMVVKTDNLPWDKQDQPSSANSASSPGPPKLGRQLSARLPKSFGLFAKDKN